MIFIDRKDVGKQLALKLDNFSQRNDVIILSLLSGAVSVGFEIAIKLSVAFDILPLHILKLPYNKFLSVGAASIGGYHFIEDNSFNRRKLSESEVALILHDAEEYLVDINLKFRQNKTSVDLDNKIVILVDDGSADPEAILAAIKIIQMQNVHSVILAIPVASYEFIQNYSNIIENIICISECEDQTRPEIFYRNFVPVPDQEIKLLIERINYSGLIC